VDIIYTLAAVHNFININNTNNLDNDLEMENKKNIRLAKAKNNIVMN